MAGIEIRPQPPALFAENPDGLPVMSDAEYFCAIGAGCETTAPTSSAHPARPQTAAVHGEPPADLESFVAGVERMYAPGRPFEMISVDWSDIEPGDHWNRHRWDGIEDQSHDVLDGGTRFVAWAGQVSTGGRTYEQWPIGQILDYGPGSGGGPYEWPYQLPTDCPSGWQHRGFDVVVNRPARHIACGLEEFWIDEEWRLITRYQNNPDPLGLRTSFWEITSLAFAPQPAELFELPPGLDIRCHVCASPSPRPPPTLVGPTWGRETKFTRDGDAITMVQTLVITTGGQIGLDLGCDTGVGSVSIQGDTLRVTDLVLTEVECSSEGRAAAEPGTRFGAALLAGEEIAYTNTAGTLELRFGSEVMQFIVSSEPPPP